MEHSSEQYHILKALRELSETPNQLAGIDLQAFGYEIDLVWTKVAFAQVIHQTTIYPELTRKEISILSYGNYPNDRIEGFLTQRGRFALLATLLVIRQIGHILTRAIASLPETHRTLLLDYIDQLPQNTSLLECLQNNPVTTHKAGKTRPTLALRNDRGAIVLTSPPSWVRSYNEKDISKLEDQLGSNESHSLFQQSSNPPPSEHDHGQQPIPSSTAITQQSGRIQREGHYADLRVLQAGNPRLSHEHQFAPQLQEPQFNKSPAYTAPPSEVRAPPLRNGREQEETRSPTLHSQHLSTEVLNMVSKRQKHEPSGPPPKFPSFRLEKGSRDGRDFASVVSLSTLCHCLQRATKVDSVLRVTTSSECISTASRWTKCKFDRHSSLMLAKWVSGADATPQDLPESFSTTCLYAFLVEQGESDVFLRFGKNWIPEPLFELRGSIQVDMTMNQWFFKGVSIELNRQVTTQ